MFIVIKLRKLLTVNDDASLTCRLESGQQPQQGRLARAGDTDNGRRFALYYPSRNLPTFSAMTATFDVSMIMVLSCHTLWI